MDIKVLKLVTGEEMIAQLESDITTYTVIKPQKFIMTQEGIASMPFIPFSKDEKFTIQKSHVLVVCEPEDDIKNVYNSKHGSGVIVAKGFNGIIQG